MRTNRVQDWPTLLFHFIEVRRGVAFQWGKHDCCLFAADGILAQTGTDLAASLRGTYKDALGAARLLKRLGGVEALAEQHFAVAGYRTAPPLMAQRGDIVLLPADATGNPGEGPALGVCLSADAAFPSAHGLTFVPVSACSRAWRVG